MPLPDFVFSREPLDPPSGYLWLLLRQEEAVKRTFPWGQLGQ